MFASICCKIVTTINMIIVFDTPPVISVIIPENTIAIIAPKYGIMLNIPIIAPNNTAYLTPIIFIAIEARIPTIIASTNWLSINLKNTLFELLKYFSINLYVCGFEVDFISFLKNPRICSLSDSIYKETMKEFEKLGRQAKIKSRKIVKSLSKSYK